MVQKLITELLDSPLSNATELGRRAHDGKDSILRVIGETPPCDRSTRAESREDFIFRNLGHMPANPSNAARREALIQSYTFGPVNPALDVVDERVVNADSKSVRDFTETMISACKYQRDIHTATETSLLHGAANENRLFILHGPRGCGKTFFVNYVLSHFADRLDAHKILWVRVDLTRDTWRFSGSVEDAESSDLLEWIYAQTTKIAMRYYNVESRYYTRGSFDVSKAGLFEHLKKYIHECDLPELRVKMQGAYQRMREVFEGRTGEQPLRAALVQSDLTRQVVSFLARQLQCGFVVILDGFDRLDITPKDIRRHERLIAEVASLAGAAEPLGLVLLCVMRTNTLEANPNPYRRAPIARSYRVAAHPLKGILQNRVAYLEKQVPIEARARPQWQIVDWPGHLRDFTRFVEAKEEGGRSRIEELLKIFDQNRRAQMQIIQLAYFDYLGLGKGLQYKLIERMVKAGFRYPPRHYKYERSGKKVVPRRADDIGLDNRFVPSIFSFPCVIGSPRDSFNHTPFDMLIGLRLLQLVKAFEKHRLKIDDSQPLAVFEACNFLSWLFGYDKEMLARLIVEYAEFEIWTLGGELHWTEGSLAELRIRPQAKLEFMIERCIFDIAYLALAIMRSPIAAGEGHEQMTGGRVPYITLASFDRGDGDERLSKWIECKFINSISVYRLVRALNEIQQRKMPENMKRVSHERRYLHIRDAFLSSSPFDFIKRMRQVLPREIESLLLTPIKPATGERPINSAELRASIEKYRRSWCK